MVIQPRRFGEVLNEWFRTLGRNWKSLVLTSLVVHLPLGLIVGTLFLTTDAGSAFEIYLDPESLEELAPSEALDLLEPFLWTAAVWTLLQLVAAVYVYLASARIVAADNIGTATTWQEAAGFAWRKLLRGIGATLLVLVVAAGVFTVAGLLGWAVIASFGATFFTVFLTATLVLTSVVAVIWLGVSVALACPAIALDATGPYRALTRSFMLTQGRWWITFGFLALIAVIGSTVSQVLGFALAPLFLAGVLYSPALAAGIAASVILQGVLMAALGAGQTLWYIDCRARREPTLAADLLG